MFYQAIKGNFKIHGEGVQPMKATGTRWIEHLIRAMGRLVDKVGLYARKIKEFIDTEKNSKTKVTVTVKLVKVLDGQPLLRSALLKDLPIPAKVFSLVTQKQDLHIIETVEGVEKTKQKYKQLLKKFSVTPIRYLSFPHLSQSSRISRGKVTTTMR